MADQNWIDVGSVENCRRTPSQHRRRAARACPVVQGRPVRRRVQHVQSCRRAARRRPLDGDYIICPWHNWKFHRCTGLGEPGFEEDAVPAYAVKVEGGRVLVDMASVTKRTRKPHAPHPLSRKIERAPGPIADRRHFDLARWTKPTRAFPAPIICSVTRSQQPPARRRKPADPAERTEIPRLRGLLLEGGARLHLALLDHADGRADQMDRVYEALVHWADVIIVASPIRWGAASSLYFKMAERLNCVQNAITIRNQVLIRNKVAGFIIVGGQDNIQGVAGQMLGFFAELGFIFPQFPYIAHSRGWSAEDMERKRRDRARLARIWRKAQTCWPSAASISPLIWSRATRRRPRSSAAAARRTICTWR